MTKILEIESFRRDLPGFMDHLPINMTPDGFFEVGPFPGREYPDPIWIAHLMIASGMIREGTFADAVGLIVERNTFLATTVAYSEDQARRLVEFALVINGWPWSEKGLADQAKLNRYKHIGAGATIVDIDWMLRGGIASLSHIELTLATLGLPGVTDSVIPLVVSHSDSIDNSDCVLRQYLEGKISLSEIMTQYNEQ